MNRYKHILVAVDFSASADQIITRASEIAKRDDARLSLLHVVEYLPPIESLGEPFATTSWDIDEQSLLNRAEQLLQDLCKKHKLDDSDLNVEVAVEMGTPKHVITQYVEDKSCDLIVMGSHGRHGISMLLGSTANAVLHDMPCDILTIKI